MSKFHTRLKKLRIDSGYTQDQLAKKLGITKSRLGMYEIGQRNPDFETLELIADFFNVDMNYLLGKSSTTARTQLNNISAIADKVELMATKTALLQKNEIIDSISNRLKKALEIRNMTQADLVKKTGIGKSSISTYLSGDYEPKQKNTYKLAKALNVNEVWLMGYDVDIERKDNSVNLSDKELKLEHNYNLLNNVGKIEAQKRIEELTLIDLYSIWKTIFHHIIYNLHNIP